jgi:hypothetical protein
MPVSSLILPIERPFRLNALGEFYRRNFYHSLDFDLRTGRSMSMTVENGKIISVADARRMVALARAQGWLAPYSQRWSRLSEQNLRVDKWSVCRG